MEKKPFYTETAYILGIVFVALGVVFMERPDFGVSMVVAPAYILFLKVSQYLDFFTFGMAEYTLQAVLLVLMCLVLRKFRLSFFFSFITAVVYGVVLDLLMLVFNALFDVLFSISDAQLWVWTLRILLYIAGMIFCSFGVAMMFRTYISPEVYELFVKEVAGGFGVEIHKFKTGYDCISTLVAVLLSFVFFGLWHFEGVKLGTFICAAVNGKLISLFSARFEKRLEFRDRFGLRTFFTGEKPLR